MKYIILDTETANDIDNAIAYDIGFAVADRKGNIYEKHSLMVAEMFFHNVDLLNTAYYAEKLPSYWKDYAKGKRRQARGSGKHASADVRRNTLNLPRCPALPHCKTRGRFSKRRIQRFSTEK